MQEIPFFEFGREMQKGTSLCRNFYRVHNKSTIINHYTGKSARRRIAFCATPNEIGPLGLIDGIDEVHERSVLVEQQQPEVPLRLVSFWSTLNMANM
jgi:hypothetical protein